MFLAKRTTSGLVAWKIKMVRNSFHRDPGSATSCHPMLISFVFSSSDAIYFDSTLSRPLNCNVMRKRFQIFSVLKVFQKVTNGTLQAVPHYRPRRLKVAAFSSWEFLCIWGWLSCSAIAVDLFGWHGVTWQRYNARRTEGLGNYWDETYLSCSISQGRFGRTDVTGFKELALGAVAGDCDHKCICIENCNWLGQYELGSGTAPKSVHYSPSADKQNVQEVLWYPMPLFELEFVRATISPVRPSKHHGIEVLCRVCRICTVNSGLSNNYRSIGRTLQRSTTKRTYNFSGVLLMRIATRRFGCTFTKEDEWSQFDINRA